MNLVYIQYLDGFLFNSPSTCTGNQRTLASVGMDGKSLFHSKCVGIDSGHQQDHSRHLHKLSCASRLGGEGDYVDKGCGEGKKTVLWLTN